MIYHAAEKTAKYLSLDRFRQTLTHQPLGNVASTLHSILSLFGVILIREVVEKEKYWERDKD